MGIIVKNCSSSDLIRIREIERASFDDPYSLSTFETMLSRQPDGFRVAEIDGEIQAYCACFLDHSRKALIIISLAVTPEFRRRGIASMLVRDMMSFAMSLSSATRIILQVSVDNLSAQKLYLKFGFSFSNVIKDYYGRSKDAFEMELKLED